MKLSAILFILCSNYLSVLAQVPDIIQEKEITLDSAALHLRHSPVYFTRFLRTHAGKYLLGGNSDGSHIAMALSDTDGVVQWYREFEYPIYSAAFDITEGKDSSYALIGQKDSMAMAVILLGQNGDVLFERRIELPRITAASLWYPQPAACCIRPLRDGGYIISCVVYGALSLYCRMGFIKINSQGERIWTKYINADGSSAPTQAIEGTNGNIIFTGFRIINSPKMRYGILSGNGDSICLKDVPSTDFRGQWLESVFEIRPNEFLLAGKWGMDDGTEVILVTIDSTGTILRQRFLGIDDGTGSGGIHNFSIFSDDSNCLYIKTNKYLFKLDNTLKIKWSLSHYSDGMCFDNSFIPYLLFRYYKNTMIAKVGFNYPPFFTSDSIQLGKQFEACVSYSDTIHAQDTFPNDSLKYRLTGNVPAGLTVDSLKGIMQWTPGYADTGTHLIGVIVKDRKDQTDTIRYTLTVRWNKNSTFIKSPENDTIAIRLQDTQTYTLTPSTNCIQSYQISWFVDKSPSGWGNSFFLRPSSAMNNKILQIRAIALSGTDTLYSTIWNTLVGNNPKTIDFGNSAKNNKIFIFNGAHRLGVFELPEMSSKTSTINLQIFNLKGELIATAASQLNNNSATISLNCINNQGLYLCALRINDKTLSKKLLLAK